MRITLEPVSVEYGLFRDQYDELLADLRRQRLDVRLTVLRIEPSDNRPDHQSDWDLVVRLSEVADTVAAVASITYAIRSRLQASGPPGHSVRRAIIYFPRDGKRAFHALEIPAADW
jgi:hypothetical protein